MHCIYYISADSLHAWPDFICASIYRMKGNCWQVGLVVYSVRNRSCQTILHRYNYTGGNLHGLVYIDPQYIMLMKLSILDSVYCCPLIQGTQLFENRPDFWEPDDQVNRIYDQLAQNRCREIPSDHLKYVCRQNKICIFTICCNNACSITSEIGSGEFGIVSRATWQLQIGGKREVAVKQLRQGASNEERAKFLQEGARMMQFFHTNVVKLQGMVTIGDTVSFRGTVCNLQYGSQYTPMQPHAVVLA